VSIAGAREVTRSRAYRKNDQAGVEQKNGAIVRPLVGYERFEEPAERVISAEAFHRQQGGGAASRRVRFLCGDWVCNMTPTAHISGTAQTPLSNFGSTKSIKIISRQYPALQQKPRIGLLHEVTRGLFSIAMREQGDHTWYIARKNTLFAE
jgi:hypothetical protein